uniref:Uncharacterized protein n=1 Tax=Romanomermis culicivorax TaxID=13658 RepID=A0A915KWP1_ROMCU
MNQSQSSRIRKLSNLGNVFSLRKAGPKGVPPCPLMEHSPLRTSVANFLPKPELVNRAGKGVSGLIRGIFKEWKLRGMNHVAPLVLQNQTGAKVRQGAKIRPAPNIL